MLEYRWRQCRVGNGFDSYDRGADVQSTERFGSYQAPAPWKALQAHGRYRSRRVGQSQVYKVAHAHIYNSVYL
jgi:hypothetical protein